MSLTIFIFWQYAISIQDHQNDKMFVSDLSDRTSIVNNAIRFSGRLFQIKKHGLIAIMSCGNNAGYLNIILLN